MKRRTVPSGHNGDAGLANFVFAESCSRHSLLKPDPFTSQINSLCENGQGTLPVMVLSNRPKTEQVNHNCLSHTGRALCSDSVGPLILGLLVGL